jgi:hypothetical protein
MSFSQRWCIFLDITHCNLVKSTAVSDQYVTSIFCLFCLRPDSYCFIAWLSIQPWKLGKDVPPKHPMNFTKLRVLYPRRENSSSKVFSLYIAILYSGCSFHTKSITILFYLERSRDSAVGIATGYGQDDRGVGVRVPVGSRIFSFPLSPCRFWGLPSLLSNGYRGFIPRGKTAGAWSWPLTSNYCRGQENMELYIHFLHTPSWHSA